MIENNLKEEINAEAQHKKASNSLIGTQTKAVVLDATTKLDIDTQKVLIDNIIDGGLNGRLDASALDNFTNIANSRDQIYQLIDTMAQDSTVSAILRTYSEDVCEAADNGHIVWCESSNPDITKFVNYLLNVMNVDKNIYGWVYSLIKYGDVYLRLYRESDHEDVFFDKSKINKMYSARNVLNEELNKMFSVENLFYNKEEEEEKEILNENVILNLHDTNDHYSHYIEMIADPSTMFELVKFGKTYGYIETPNVKTSSLNSENNPLLAGDQNSLNINYRLKSNEVNIFQADDFVHAYLDDCQSRFPEQVELLREGVNSETVSSKVYNVRRGKSLLYDSYKIWREKSLLESSAILNRITRSSILRKVSVEVGDMPKEQVQVTLRRVKEMMEQKTSLNTGNSMTEYTNPGPMENSIYFATHNGQGAITVESVGGDVDVKNLADLDWWNNKFYSSYGIPKQYFGWTEDGAGFNGGQSLSILSSVYAKGVKRVQNAILQALTDAINLMLLDKGCNSYLNNFVLKMKAPVTQEEIDYRADLTNRISAISNMQSLFSDVEDRSRKLSILKALFETLNYNPEILAIIQTEIDAAEKAAEEEAASADTSEDTDLPADDTSDADLDLTAMPESVDFEELEEKELLFESSDTDEISENHEILTEADVLIEEDDLPSPEDLNSEIDFTENK